ncbi:MAG: VUT family protein [Thermotogae bacterium]|nr:MAG: VUT family protein [Thermotogota bacterium]RKX56051.1 MAG: VUT family protein [Thermotoga sp.]HDG62582.1 VUT family protein [Thermotoga sp.]
MSNEFLWMIFVVLDLTSAIIIYRFFGKAGLFGLIVMSGIVCNIQVVKLVELFGFTATLGNVLYASIFFATDILSEMYGKKEAKKGVLLGFVTLIVATLWMQIALFFKPSPHDTMDPALKKIFSIMPRITIASIIAYLLSQFHDVWAFHFWKRKTKGKFLWLRNNASTMVSQAIDTVVFTTIAFLGTVSTSTFLSIMLTTYFLKWLVALFDTPFLYLARKIGMRFKLYDPLEMKLWQEKV